MMRKWLIMLAVLAAGCADPTGERDFRLTIREVAGPVEPGASVETGLGGIHVSGALIIGCENGGVGGELERPGARELLLLIDAVWPAECNDVATFYTYDAFIEALASGTWDLTVVHATNRSGVPADTVFDGPVVVP
jgi:hypothetical protein